MKNPSLLAALAFLAIALAYVFPSVRSVTAQTITPLVVVVSPRVTDKEISLALLRRVFRGEPTEFNGSRLVPFNYAPDSALRRTFDKAVLGMSPEDAGSFWIDRRIRGQGMPPRTVPSPQIMKALVAKLPGAIGYIPADQVDASVLALAVEGKSANAPGYPIR